MLTLYHYPPSTTSIKVRLCLHEKRLRFEERIVDLTRFEHLAPEYRALNPACVVPTLIHDDRSITDSTVINEYLEEAFPEPRLLAGDAHARATARMWVRYVDEVPTIAVQSPTFAAFVAPALRSLPPSELEERIARIPDRQTRARWMRAATGAIDDAEIAESYATMATVLDRMESTLLSGPWLAGMAYTLADLAMTPSVIRLEHLGRGDLLESRPRVASWVARVRSRPSFAAAYAFLDASSAAALAPASR